MLEWPSVYLGEVLEWPCTFLGEVEKLVALNGNIAALVFFSVVERTELSDSSG